MTVYKNVRLTASCPECDGTGRDGTDRVWDWTFHTEVNKPAPCVACTGLGRVAIPTADLPSVLASLVPGAETIRTWEIKSRAVGFWDLPRYGNLGPDATNVRTAVVFPELKESEADRREQILTELAQDAQDMGGYDDEGEEATDAR